MNNFLKKFILALMINGCLVKSELPLSSQHSLPEKFREGYEYIGTSNSYGEPLGHHGQDEQRNYIDSQPKSYEFGYTVKDEATGNDFGRQEASDGETVRGEYRVQLPDGRMQIVTYTADWRTGFHADVRYEGIATYPDQYETNNHGYDYSRHDSGYDYSGNIDTGYKKGNNAGHSGYQNRGGNYNSAPDFNHQYGSNSIPDNNYNSYSEYSRDSFGSQTPTYGTPAYR